MSLIRTVFGLVNRPGGLASKTLYKVVRVAYTKEVTFLYISLFSRGGCLNKILSKDMDKGLKEGGGIQERVY